MTFPAPLLPCGEAPRMQNSSHASGASYSSRKTGQDREASFSRTPRNLHSLWRGQLASRIPCSAFSIPAFKPDQSATCFPSTAAA